MGNGLVGAICGAAVAMIISAAIRSGDTTWLAIAALAGGGVGGLAGAYGHDVATGAGMRLLRYVVIAAIFGVTAMLFRGAPAFAALP